jgi:cytochrome o ubiquinol oxidase operon protein cyoD
VCGFVFAIGLTLVAYFLVTNHVLTGGLLTVVIMGLAAVQLVVQLVFFLHLGRDKGSRWNVATFYFMLLILLVIVAGSLWIMENLNYNMMMTPEQMNEYMLKESQKGF